MTDLQWASVTPKKHRHDFPVMPYNEWQEMGLETSAEAYYPCRCGMTVAEFHLRQRRGRSATRLGKDQERGFEREHGPTKIGERGDAVDHLGRFGKYQVKSTRRPVAPLLRNIDRMDGMYGERVPVLVQRFVRHGVKTETYVTLRLRDWQALHGRDEE